MLGLISDVDGTTRGPAGTEFVLGLISGVDGTTEGPTGTSKYFFRIGSWD